MNDETTIGMWDRADEVMKLAMAQSPYAFLLMPEDLVTDPWLTAHILGERRCPKHPTSRKLDRVMYGAAGDRQFIVLAHDCETCGDLLPVHMPWVDPPAEAMTGHHTCVGEHQAHDATLNRAARRAARRRR